ncbi:hypothetical protein BGZ79_004883 [Entomortierella chlamydospora]|nr:hypothetical protein BGZ79_004883 [Entomortierella chlamydospora]
MLGALISHTSALPTSKISIEVTSLTSSNPAQDFIIPIGKGPACWSSYVNTAIQPKGTSTSIVIGQHSSLKPYYYGEHISRKKNLDYGTYSVNMISTSTLGRVTGFFLITMNGTEIDIELTGLNSTIVHLT